MLAQAPPLRELSNATTNKTSATAPHQSDRPAKRRKVHPSPTDHQPESFELFPHSSSSIASISLHARPYFLFPRAKLPLHFLHASAALNSRFYSANIHVLEQHSSSSSWLLIVSLDNEQELCAIERIRCGLYSLSRLAGWVNTATLRAHAVPFGEINGGDICFSSLHFHPQRDHNSLQWWSAAAIAHGSLEYQPQAATTTPAAVAGVTMDNETAKEIEEVQTTLTSVRDPDQPSESQSSFDEIKPSIIQQYLDCLYCSKAPVTFFAKSALSRARAVARAANSSCDLANFLRSLVLTVPMAEQKYKTIIPDVITSHVPRDQGFAETSSPFRSVGVKKNKSKKLKPRKNGLFPDEEDFIKSWWSSIDCVPAHPDEASSRATQDSYVGRLRFRETLLQLVLSFEALYIESSPEITQGTGCNANEQTEVGSTSERPKAKRPRDLAKLIDILIDKSIIWQSTDTTHVSDQLRDFYLQLVRPFYGARLSVLVTQVGKKLGISTGISAKESSGGKRSDKPSKIAPGTEISRSSATMKGRKSLQRVSSETLNAKRPPSSLLRSMTDSMVSKAAFELERNPKDAAVESSSTIPEQYTISRSTSVARDDGSHRPLSRSNSISITQREDSHRPLSRSGSVNLSSQNLKQREVDLSAIAKFKRAKPKKVEVEQELQDAIAALKKPNRGLAARTYVDAAEKRAAASQSRSKASRNVVEVSSTPRRPGKTHQGIAATPHRTRLPNHEKHSSEIPASSPFVPMSTIKNGNLPGPVNATAKPPSLIASTPSAKVRTRSIFETPSRTQNHTGQPTPLPAGEQTISEQGASQTPTKRRKLNTCQSGAERAQQTESSVSIYDELGWDNDVDELA